MMNENQNSSTNAKRGAERKLETDSGLIILETTIKQAQNRKF